MYSGNIRSWSSLSFHVNLKVNIEYEARKKVIRCLDITSTDNYNPNVTTSEGYDPKTKPPSNITSVVRYDPCLDVHTCFNLDVLSHVT